MLWQWQWQWLVVVHFVALFYEDVKGRENYRIIIIIIIIIIIMIIIIIIVIIIIIIFRWDAFLKSCFQNCPVKNKFRCQIDKVEKTLVKFRDSIW